MTPSEDAGPGSPEKLGAARRRQAKKILTGLLESFPLPFPVVFRWNANCEANRAESYVRTSKSGKRIGYIGLNDTEELFTMQQMLCHEMAHLMVWDYPGRDHDAAWAVAYRETYAELYGGH